MALRLPNASHTNPPHPTGHLWRFSSGRCTRQCRHMAQPNRLLPRHRHWRTTRPPWAHWAKLATTPTPPHRIKAHRLSYLYPNVARQYAILRHLAYRPCDGTQSPMVDCLWRHCPTWRVCPLPTRRFICHCCPRKPTRPMRDYRRRPRHRTKRNTRAAQSLPHFLL